MTLIGDELVLDSGKKIYAPRAYDFLRVGDFVEYKLPFDTGRELFIMRSAHANYSYWKIWRTRAERCFLERGRQELALPAGVFVADRPITGVIQVAANFIIYYRDLRDQNSPIDCVSSTGSALWRLPRLYIAIYPIADTDEFIADHGPMTSRISGKTGEVLEEYISH